MDYSLNFIILLVTVTGLAVSIYLAIEIKKICRRGNHTPADQTKAAVENTVYDDATYAPTFFGVNLDDLSVTSDEEVGRHFHDQRFDYATSLDNEVTMNIFPSEELEEQLQNKGYATLHFNEDVKTNLPDNSYTVRKAQLTLGRHKDNNILIQDPAISRSHCIITFDGEKAFIEDLNTTNGTYVDGERIHQKVPLPRSCMISLGPVSFTLECH